MVKRSVLCLLLGACGSPAVARADAILTGRATGSWNTYAGGPGNPFPLAQPIDADAAAGGAASLRFGLPLFAPAVLAFDGAGSDPHVAPGFDGVGVRQFDIGRLTYGGGTILAGTGLDFAVLGIDLALALPGRAVPLVEAYSLDFVIRPVPMASRSSTRRPSAFPAARPRAPSAPAASPTPCRCWASRTTAAT